MTGCTYVLEGSGRFPVDLLPDEQAWPRNTWDARGMGALGKRRLEMQGLRRPNDSAWQQAGWVVCRVDTTRL